MDKKRKIYLHIGVHKTGTTSIQDFCAREARILAEGGIVYPDYLRFGKAHHILSWSLVGRFSKNVIASQHIISAREIKNIIKSIDGEKLLFSSEAFCFAGEDDLKIISDIFEDFDVYVIIFIRRQDKIIESEYCQRLDQAEDPEIRCFSDFITVADFILPQIRYFDLYTRWKRKFDNIMIVNFENAVKSGRLIESFLNACEAGVEIDKNTELFLNKKPSLYYLSLLRFVNILAKDVEERARLRKMILPLANCAGEVPETFYPHGLDADVYGRYHQQNKKLFDARDFKNSGERPFELPSKTVVGQVRVIDSSLPAPYEALVRAISNL